MLLSVPVATEDWLGWARRLQALAQSGLAYSKDEYDVERFHAIREIAAEILSAHGAGELDGVRAMLEQERGYATPKIDVRAVVLREGRLLLVKERSDGCWTLPGGWVDVGESLSEAAARETEEEAGYRVRPMRLLAVYDRRRHAHPPMFHHVYKIFISCRLEGTGLPSGGETEDPRFFDPEALPPLSLARVTPEQIKRLLEIQQHPDWPADFD